MTHDKRIQRLLITLALTVAVGIAVLLPLGFVLLRYSALVEQMDSKARLSAGRVARHIFISPRLWEFQVVRLTELIEFAAADRANHRQTILSNNDRVVVVETTPIARPSASRVAPIIVNDSQVGTIKIETSLRPLLLETAAVSLAAILFAAFSFSAFHRFPLRAIRGTMERLARERARVNDTLIELRASEAKLIAQGKELSDVQRVACLGGWSMKPNGADLAVSEQTLNVLGISLEQAANFPEYLEAAGQGGTSRTFRELIRQAVKSLEVCEMDFRFHRPDGNVIDIQIRLWPIEVNENWVLRLGGTLQDISKAKEAERRLQTLAYFDPLTGLANRTLFRRELASEVERVKREGDQTALLLIDLDRFKDVNDSLGHAAGDLLLTRVAQILKNLMPENAFIARLGGDEFAIILRGQAGDEDISSIAQSTIDAVEEPITLGRSEAKIGASIGIARIIKDADDGATLLKYADLALYQAKGRGRACFAFFDNAMNETVQHKTMIARDLRLAVATNEGLEVWFQPLLALEDRRIHGFEALMRWKHPQLGYIPPSDFIPIAESSSLISDLGNWILQETAQTAKAWIDAGGDAYEVSVNLSPAQIWQSDLDVVVAKILTETGLPPHLLCLELTESVFVDHSEARVKEVLLSLKALGVKLALDDFGTGYSSLAYLTQLPFDKLKIDRAFVQEAPVSAKGRRVLEGIIALGHGLGMTVVAEGIEEENELAILEAARCDLVQGYLIARPKPAAEALSEAAKLVEALRSVSVRGNVDAIARVA